MSYSYYDFESKKKPKKDHRTLKVIFYTTTITAFAVFSIIVWNIDRVQREQLERAEVRYNHFYKDCVIKTGLANDIILTREYRMGIRQHMFAPKQLIVKESDFETRTIMKGNYHPFRLHGITEGKIVWTVANVQGEPIQRNLEKAEQYLFVVNNQELLYTHDEVCRDLNLEYK